MTARRPQWADKTRFWLTDTLYERVEKAMGVMNAGVLAASHAVERRIENGVERVETVGLWALCQVYGHEPVADQCDKPEHDFCVYCSRPMPGGAHDPRH